MIAEAWKLLKYKAFADFDAIKIALWRKFDATKCSDDRFRQSILIPWKFNFDIYGCQFFL